MYRSVLYIPDLQINVDKSKTTNVKNIDSKFSKKYPPNHTIKGNKTTE